MKAIDRLYQYLEDKGVKPTTFEKDMGFSSGYLSVQRKRSADLGESVLKKILDNCQDIDPSWLLTGQKIQVSLDGNDKSRNTEKVANVNYNSNKLIGIPLIPINAEAGAFTCDVQISEHECEYFNVPTFAGADFLITVRGDSMIPGYKSGDIVACKKIELGTYIQWNRVYVIDIDQGPLIKRIRPGTTKDVLVIVSDNSEFQPFEINVKDVRHLALVLGSIRPE